MRRRDHDDFLRVIRLCSSPEAGRIESLPHFQAIAAETFSAREIDRHALLTQAARLPGSKAPLHWTSRVRRAVLMNVGPPPPLPGLDRLTGEPKGSGSAMMLVA
jgi:hypothetical protein